MLSPEEAIEWGITGPPLRGSGVEWDLRRAQPYECYPELEFDMPIGKNGDTYDRYLVRMAEMRQSNRILQQCIPLIKATPAGDIKAKISQSDPPAGRGGLPLHRIAEGRARLLHRLRRQDARTPTAATCARRRS